MSRKWLAGLGLGALVLAACADERPGPNGTITPGQRFSGLYVTHEDGTIARIDLDTRVTTSIRVGQEPARIARVGGRVYVSLRTERAVVVFEESDTGLVEVARIATGAEPVGVAANSSRIFVAASLSGRVSEYDASSFAELRSWQLPGEPRFVTLHHNNKRLYVASAFGGLVHSIDLVSGRTERLPLPEVIGFSPRTGQQFTFASRVTGDMAVAPDGSALVVPALHFDNITPIRNVTGDVEDPCDDSSGASAPPPGPGVPVPPRGGDCGGYNSSQKFNPTVDVIPLDGDGDVATTRPVEAVALQTNAVDANGQFVALSAYPSAVAVSEDSRLVVATMEGASAAVFLPLTLDGGAVNPPTRAASDGGFFPGGGSFSFRPIVAVLTGAGPRGVALIGNDKAYVHAFFDRQVELIDLTAVRARLGGNAAGSPLPVDPRTGIPEQSLRAVRVGAVGARFLSAEADEGRRMFYSATDTRMTTPGAGVTCATCHFESRTDGVTWSFNRGPRQTPMLAVGLEHALPVGWAGNVATVADEGMNTSQKLMGGQGLRLDEMRNVEAFLYSLRKVDAPNKGLNDAQVQLGQQLFNRVGCVSCHNGPAYTDNKVYAMLGLEAVKTRPLSSIAGSPPYFHTGEAETLDQVVELAARGEMGPAFSINSEEKAALVAFLKSL